MNRDGNGKIVSIEGRTAKPRVRDNPVLVVDGNDVERRIMERTLAQAGYRVAVARNDEEGLDLLLDVDPSLVLLGADIEGGQDAFVKTARVMLAGDRPRPVFILVAAPGQAARPCVEHGNERVLVMPFAMPKLLSVVDAALRKEPVSSQPADRESDGARLLPDSLASLASFEDADFIESLIGLAFGDLDRILVELEGLLFRPDGTAIRQALRSMYGLSLSIGASELSSVVRKLLDGAPDESPDGHRAMVAGLRKLVPVELERCRARYLGGDGLPA